MFPKSFYRCGPGGEPCTFRGIIYFNLCNSVLMIMEK